MKFPKRKEDLSHRQRNLLVRFLAMKERDKREAEERAKQDPTPKAEVTIPPITDAEKKDIDEALGLG